MSISTPRAGLISNTQVYVQLFHATLNHMVHFLNIAVRMKLERMEMEMEMGKNPKRMKLRLKKIFQEIS